LRKNKRRDPERKMARASNSKSATQNLAKQRRQSLGLAQNAVKSEKQKHCHWSNLKEKKTERSQKKSARTSKSKSAAQNLAKPRRQDPSQNVVEPKPQKH